MEFIFNFIGMLYIQKFFNKIIVEAILNKKTSSNISIFCKLQIKDFHPTFVIYITIYIII